MGGLIALCSALELNSTTALPRVAAAADDAPKLGFRWDALIASAAAIVLDPELATPPLQMAANVLGAMLPKMVLDGVPPSHLSRNEAAIAAYVRLGAPTSVLLC